MNMKRGILVFCLVIGFIMPGANSLKVVYNTTNPLQFLGNDSFENQDDVRVIYRPDPLNILPGEKTVLSYTVENPTELEQRFSIKLIDVPKGFKSSDESLDIILGPLDSSKIDFILDSEEDIAPRSYWYGFDVVVEGLKDGEILSVQKRLGTYNGLNIVEESPEKGDERVTGVFSMRVLLLIIGLIMILLFIYMKTRK